ncbi:hypothetical protein [Streptomyces sp. URMC 129]|uniref:hypothetical protein n=1 Tax=Streptomyces sp. URMC 129 TaxID=3423407 RepID=UPI003F1B6601
MGYYERENWAERCEQCGGPLNERQERYCSARCRQAAYRARKIPGRKEREWKTCPLCGELFEVTRPGKKFCDYWDEAEADCKAAQDDLEEAAEEAAQARQNAVCENCGEPAGWSGRGRPRRYCSNRCKTAAYRHRKAAEAAQR